jgi:hypothetical protein
VLIRLVDLFMVRALGWLALLVMADAAAVRRPWPGAYLSVARMSSL